MHAFLDETLGSAILDSGAFKAIFGMKWYEYFLETILEKQRYKIKVKSFYTATLLCVNCMH